MNASEIHAAERLLDYLSDLVDLQRTLNEWPAAQGFFSVGIIGQSGVPVAVERNLYAKLLGLAVSDVRAELATMGVDPDA